MTDSRYRQVADDVLAHSSDSDEWEDEPEVVERRPRGTQVISARLPEVLAESLLALAAERGVSPSQVVREAVERYVGTDESAPAAQSLWFVESGTGGLSSGRRYGIEGGWVREQPTFQSVFVALGTETTEPVSS